MRIRISTAKQNLQSANAQDRWNRLRDLYFQILLPDLHARRTCCGVNDWRPHMHERGRGRWDLWRRVSRYASSQHKEYASYTVVLAVFFPDAEGVERSCCFQMCLPTWVAFQVAAVVVLRSDVARRRQWTRSKLALALRVGQAEARCVHRFRVKR